MAIKRMCDQCGAELDGAAAPHGNHGSTEGDQTEGLQIKHGDIRVRLTAGRSGHPIGTGDWCKYCMLDAVAKLDGRPGVDTDTLTRTIDAMQRQIDDQRSQINRLNDVNNELRRKLQERSRGSAGGAMNFDPGAAGTSSVGGSHEQN